ncbi:putative quinol monooxygenase [Actinomadura sp. 6N118]|uniref:putative quinol monooxygenase n=1 Tax=Actinomadura sp. 6N118 TaxID=3375151 RepID=UPI00379DAF82
MEAPTPAARAEPRQSGEEVIVAGWIDWAPEDRHRALECFLEATGPTLAEPGCLAYTVTPDPGDPRRLHVFERWRSAASLDEHLATEHIATFRARSASLTRIGRGLYRYRVVDGEPMSSSRQSHAKES